MKQTIAAWLFVMIIITSCHKQTQFIEHPTNSIVDFSNLGSLQVQVTITQSMPLQGLEYSLSSNNGAIQKIYLDPFKKHNYAIRVLNPQKSTSPPTWVNFHSTDTTWDNYFGWRSKMTLIIENTQDFDEWTINEWPSQYYKFSVYSSTKPTPEHL